MPHAPKLPPIATRLVTVIRIALSLSLVSLMAVGHNPVNAAVVQPGLLTAAGFAVLAGTTVTNIGVTVIGPPSLSPFLGGDLGLSPGSAITGFPPGQVLAPGTIHVADAVALQAQTDATTAYNTLAG